jgi:hypothetical protein
VNDPTLADLAITGGTGLGSATAVGLLFKFLLGKQSIEVTTKLAVIEEQLKQLVAAVAKHDDLSERLTKLEAHCASCKRRR